MLLYILTGVVPFIWFMMKMCVYGMVSVRSHQPGNWLNCFNNIPSKFVPDGSDLYIQLKEVCPWYTGSKPNSTHVCCDGEMLKTSTKGKQRKLSPTIAGTMSIMFSKFYECIFCDPSNSLFMNVRDSCLDNNTDTSLPAVTTTDTYVLYKLLCRKVFQLI